MNCISLIHGGKPWGKHKGIERTHFDLSCLADDAGQPIQLIHKGLELIHCQFGTVTTALRTQTAAADVKGKRATVQFTFEPEQIQY